MSRLKAIDLFCGCGGLTAGLQQAEFEVIGAVDNNLLATETYKLNHPSVHVWTTDITELPTSVVLEELNIQPGELDLLAGCPSCQGFSTIRTHNGKHKIDDPRNNLIFEFFRFIEELEPKAIMMENVPNLQREESFEEFKSRVKGLGYSYKYEVLNAADYGVPQRRKRLVFVAARHRAIDLAEASKIKTTVRDVIGNMSRPENSDDPLHNYPQNRTDRINKMISLIPTDGGSRSDLPEEFRLPCHRKNPTYFRDVYGRMKWDEVSPTITGGCVSPSKGRFLHPEQNRAITLREAAILQSFPPNYRFSLGRGICGVATMIGNALPPRFIREHAESIKNTFQEKSNGR